MPTMKNRHTSHPDGEVVSLMGAMGHGKKTYGKRPPAVPVHDALKSGGKGKKASSGLGKVSSGTHDVATHVGIPSARAMQKKSRVVGKQPKKLKGK